MVDFFGKLVGKYTIFIYSMGICRKKHIPTTKLEFQVDPGAFRLAYDTENICNYLEVDLWDGLDELDLFWVGDVSSYPGIYMVLIIWLEASYH